MYSSILCSTILFALCLQEAKCIECYQCDSSTEDSFHCKEFQDKDGSPLKSKPCSSMRKATYCVKQVLEGGLGTKRFCSALDMGNYCNYVKQLGVDREYRSCVYTCDSDGCNASSFLKPVKIVLFVLVLTTLLVSR